MDGQGTVRAEAPRPTTPTARPASIKASPPPQQLTCDLTATYCAMNASQRSMAIWKRVSPGMLPDTAQTPTSTSQDAFAYDPQLVDKVRGTGPARSLRAQSWPAGLCRPAGLCGRLAIHSGLPPSLRARARAGT